LAVASLGEAGPGSATPATIVRIGRMPRGLSRGCLHAINQSIEVEDMYQYQSFAPSSQHYGAIMQAQITGSSWKLGVSINSYSLEGRPPCPSYQTGADGAPHSMVRP
jgi:hypothetical protein